MTTRGGITIESANHVWPIVVPAGPIGRTVTIFESAWVDHIRIRHPEMDSFLDEVIGTISAPDVITEHSQHRERTYFYRAWDDPRFPAKFLCALVLLPLGEKDGKLLSAWPTDRISGGKVICLSRLPIS